VGQIFESLHHTDYREKMNWQVQKDLMGNIKNTRPSVGFFGSPLGCGFRVHLHGAPCHAALPCPHRQRAGLRRRADLLWEFRQGLP